jgi:hypothetical protein
MDGSGIFSQSPTRWNTITLSLSVGVTDVCFDYETIARKSVIEGFKHTRTSNIGIHRVLQVTGRYVYIELRRCMLFRTLRDATRQDKLAKIGAGRQLAVLLRL